MKCKVWSYIPKRNENIHTLCCSNEKEIRNDIYLLMEKKEKEKGFLYHDIYQVRITNEERKEQDISQMIKFSEIKREINEEDQLFSTIRCKCTTQEHILFVHEENVYFCFLEGQNLFIGTGTKQKIITIPQIESNAIIKKYNDKLLLRASPKLLLTITIQDIVDSVFLHLIQEGKVSDSVVDTYNKSKRWKKELIGYMHRENISMKEVANRMIENGVSVQEPTICRWLDEDAHTVGPRNINSIAQIGILVGNDDLNQNAEMYFEACREIRSIRRRILEQVGLAIIGKLSGKSQSAGAEYAAIYDRVDSLAEVLQIERLIFAESIIPMNMANRPIQIQE